VETVLLYIFGVVVIVIGLLLSIALHEIGHLVPAKKFGVRVGQYMIGFGKTLWSRKYGETEYGIKALPLGGYISMAGMYPPAHEGEAGRDANTGFMETMLQDSPGGVATHESDERVFYKLATWKRIIIMLGGPFMNLLIGILLYAIVLCGFGTAQLTSSLGEVSECLIPASSSATECTSDDPQAPAAAAGLLPGDRILSIDGVTVSTADAVREIIQASPGEDLELVIDREGAKKTITATPELTVQYVTDDNGEPVLDGNGDATTAEVGMLGISFAAEIVQEPLTAVLPAVGDNIVRVAGIILRLPEKLVGVAKAAFGPEERDPNGPIGVIGIGRIAGEISSLENVPAEQRAAGLIGILASLNIALFVFNLVPLMPLDGGHVAAALWESIRRRVALLFGRRDPGPVDISKLLPLTMAVSVVLGLMTVLLMYADIVKPITLQ